MSARVRVTRLAIAFSVAVLGGSPVAAQSGGGSAAPTVPADKTPLVRGRWVLGALLNPPLPSISGGSNGPAVGVATTTGGTAGSSVSTTVTTFGIAGTVGYMLLRNLDVGARLAYSQTTASTGPSNTSASGNNIGVYARFWLPMGESGAFQFTAQYTSRETSPPFALRSSGFGPIVGYSIFLNKRVSLDMMIPVEFNTVATTTCSGCPAIPEQKFTSYTFAVGLSVFVP